MNLLGSIFRGQGVHISFVVQKEPRGIAEAYILAEDFLDEEASTLILGDNIFEDDFRDAIQTFRRGGRIFAKEVSDPERFGVVEFDQRTGQVLSVEEKPEYPKSRYAIPGIYIFDGRAPRVAKKLPLSGRGELEIVDMHRFYLNAGDLDIRVLHGAYFDAGTHDSLLAASNAVREKNFRDRFDPIVELTLAEFNRECKRIVSTRTVNTSVI